MKQLSFKLWMRLVALAHLLLAAMVLFFPNEWAFVLNLGSLGTHLLPGGQPLISQIEPFWNVAIASGYVMSSLLALFAAQLPQVKGYTGIFLVGKGVMIVALATLLFHQARVLAYIEAVVLDSIIVFVTAALWGRALYISRNPNSEALA